MKIIADNNILFAEKVFSQFGTVQLVAGGAITRDVVRDAEMLFVRSVTRVDGALLAGSRVKFVGTATVGIDHVDTGYLREHAVGFAGAPGSNAESVAEYVIAALLVLCTKHRLCPENLTIGIIGAGNVGSRLCRLARALGMRCLLNDPPEERQTGLSCYLPLKQVLDESDIVTMHVPLETEGPDATLHLVNKSFLAAMKKDAIFINTSRGKVVDETALLKFRNKLGGLVLDVWETEPVPHSGLVEAADIATPHIAGYSYDGKLRGTRMVYEAACAFAFKSPEVDLPGKTACTQKTINVTGMRNPVAEAVLRAYPIEKDDASLKKIRHVETAGCREYFEALRRNYPKRLEFSHFRIKGAGTSASQLAGLGFRV